MFTWDFEDPRRKIPESESGTASLISFPSGPFLCVPSKRMIGTLGLTNGVSLRRHSTLSTKSPYSPTDQRFLSSPGAWLWAS